MGYLYIDNNLIGTAVFKITDESMGAVSGELTPINAYADYKNQIQKLCEKCGIANIEHLNFKVTLEDGTSLTPEGGIGIIDIPDFEEVIVEVAGLNADSIKKLCR
jgi:hypothetical protein